MLNLLTWESSMWSLSDRITGRDKPFLDETLEIMPRQDHAPAKVQHSERVWTAPHSKSRPSTGRQHTKTAKEPVLFLNGKLLFLLVFLLGHHASVDLFIF